MKHAGRGAESEAMYVEALEASRGGGGPVDERWRTTTRYNLALAIQGLGRPGEALAIFEPLVEEQSAVFGTRAAVTVRTRSELASCYARLGRNDDAEAVFARVVPELETVFGEAHPRTVEALANRGVVAGRRGEHGEAVATLELALTRLVGASTWRHPNAPAIARELARAQIRSGDVPAAAGTIARAIDAIRVSGVSVDVASSRVEALACRAVELFRSVENTSPDGFMTRLEGLCGDG